MSEPKTMREYLNRPVTADEAETEGRWDRIMIKQNDPILDAHIIRGTCPTCGGSRVVGRCRGCGEWFPDADRVAHAVPTDAGDGTPEPTPCGPIDEVPCPDCADAPVWVIAPEAWQAFRAAWREWQKERQQIDVEDAALVDVLQALLPGARRAKEVLYNATTGTDGDANPTVEYFINNDPCDHEGYRTGGRLNGDIAILHNEQEKE